MSEEEYAAAHAGRRTRRRARALDRATARDAAHSLNYGTAVARGWARVRTLTAIEGVL